MMGCRSLVVFLVVMLFAEVFTMKLKDEWENFKTQHEKKYEDDKEEAFRYKVYRTNKMHIKKHNDEFAQGIHSYDVAINEYADMLPNEFVATMNGFRRPMGDALLSKDRPATFLSPLNAAEDPATVDWREKGYVTPVKNQGHCGSCWAFSTTGSLEGQHFRKTGKLVSLSEQNLVDCSGKYGNSGCNGGLMDQAFQYIKDNKGVDTELSYPYDAVQGDCEFKRRDVGADDVGFVDVTPHGDEKKLVEAVAQVGPVSVAIDAGHQSFQFYSHGVYSDPDCSSTQLDHGVLVVGYGTDEETSQDYWLVKNSWGETWGDQGYVKIQRNKDNMCGVATQASYPLV